MAKMKKVTPTTREKELPDDQIIVSKTDLKGKITYGNEIFIDLSGYEEEELLGSPHNMIRHPDMPKLIFKLLWEEVQNGREINAYVKNLSKDGSFYWVFANVTPSFDLNGKIVGYYSVRRHPNRHAIDVIITSLYREMVIAEKTGGVTASQKILDDLLKEKGLSYEELIISVENTAR